MLRLQYRLLPILVSTWLGGLGALAAAPAPDADTFILRDWLGRAWENECVSFPLTPAQLAQAQAGNALIGPADKPVAYQLAPDNSATGFALAFLADLAPFGTQSYRFAAGKQPVSTDLVLEETAEKVVVANGLIGIEIPKALKEGSGPIARVRLKSGRWVGGSRLTSAQPLSGYSATVTARGPVFLEVTCKASFGAPSTWELRIRLNAGEPVVLLEETAAVQGDGAVFQLDLDKELKPNKIFYRIGTNNEYDRSTVAPIRAGTVFVLEPWLHWARQANQGLCFSVFNLPDAPPPETPTEPVDKAKREADALELVPAPADGAAKGKTAVANVDVLSVGAGFAGTWVDPGLPPAKPQAAPQLVLTKDAAGLHLDFPLKFGRRSWQISALDTDRCLQKIKLYGQTSAYPAASLPYRYGIKHGHFPLNLVKDYQLTWNSDASRFPHLLFTPEDAARFKAQAPDKTPYVYVAAAENPRLNQFTMGGPIKAYYATGESKLGKVIADSAVLNLQDAVDFLVKQEAMPFGAAPHHAQVIGDALILADTALGSGTLTPELRERVLAQAAFLAYTLNRPDYWSPVRGYSANPNMTTSVNGYIMAAACLANSHPLAKGWVATALKELKDEELNGWSDDNGGWLEAPHYAMVSYDQILGALIMAHNAGFSDALYSDPKIKRVINWFSKMSTPPDSRFSGFRHLPPIGNTYMIEPTGEFGVLAYLFRDKDPEFAAQMQWMYRQQKSWFVPGIGGGYPALAGYRDLLLDPTIPERAPAWKSEWSPKTMAMLRNGFPSPRETSLLLLAGGFGGWRSHWDDDSGSITVWGKGRILADDFGYYNPAQADHSMVESPALTSGIMNISTFAPQPALDYVSGLRGGWRRQIAFIKDADPLAPNYYLICDSFAAATPATWRLWLTAADVTAGAHAQPDAREEDALAGLNEKEEGAVPLPASAAAARVLRTQQVTSLGKEDVSLEVFFAQPANLELSIETKTRTANCGVHPDGSYQGAMQTTQLGIVAKLKEATRFSALLYPRLKTEKAPTFTTIAQGNGVKVESPAGTDYVFLSPEPITFQEGGVSFTGTVGAIQLRGGQTTLCLGAAGSIATKEHQLKSEQSQSQQWGAR